MAGVLPAVWWTRVFRPAHLFTCSIYQLFPLLSNTVKNEKMIECINISAWPSYQFAVHGFRYGKHNDSRDSESNDKILSYRQLLLDKNSCEHWDKNAVGQNENRCEHWAVSDRKQIPAVYLRLFFCMISCLVSVFLSLCLFSTRNRMLARIKIAVAAILTGVTVTPKGIPVTRNRTKKLGQFRCPSLFSNTLCRSRASPYISNNYDERSRQLRPIHNSNAIFMTFYNYIQRFKTNQSVNTHVPNIVNTSLT